MSQPQVFVHERGLCESETVGAATRIWAFAHVMHGAVVGEECNIGDHAFVESGAVLGDRVTVKNGVMVWDRVTVRDDVFLGPGVVFTNDMRPRATIPGPAASWSPPWSVGGRPWGPVSWSSAAPRWVKDRSSRRAPW